MLGATGIDAVLTRPIQEMCCTFAVARLLERMALLALLLLYNISAIQTTHSRNPLCCLSLPGEESCHCCALCLRGSGGGDSRALVAALGQPKRSLLVS